MWRIGMAKLNYLELPTRDVAASKRFYAAAFGMDFTDFGPGYSATVGAGGSDIGLNGTGVNPTALLLPVAEVDDLEAALAAVTGAGGKVTRPIFAFPGGRRFHFTDPDGHEIGVYVNAE